MVGRLLIVVAASVTAGCATVVGGGGGHPGGPAGDVVVVGEREAYPSPRAVRVPPGHFPPPGECRLWYPDRPAGHQPPPTRCGALHGRVPYEAFILFNDRAWDAGYDWRRHAAREPGSVPRLILDMIRVRESR